MAYRLPSYLHTLRKQWCLSQPELAVLLDLTASALCRFENSSRRPTADLIVGIEVIFGSTAEEVFPAFYREAQRDILKRVKAEIGHLQTSTETDSRERLRFLESIVERTGQTTLDL